MANSFVAFQDPATGGITWLYQKVWLPAPGLKVYGGFATAMVSITDATSGNPVNPLSSDSVKFNLIGHNPIQSDVLSVLCNNNSQFAGRGFTTNFLAAAAYQESRFAEFTDIQGCSPTLTTSSITDGYPVQACDNGYGIMQLTNGVPGGLNYNLPPKYWTGTPTQDMVWNWVSNVNAGTWVMINKFNEEMTYENKFTQDTGFYYPTIDQMQMNVWQRYNGCAAHGAGCYYVWGCTYRDPTTGECVQYGWIKNPVLRQNQYIKCTINGVGVPYADCVNNIAEQHPNDWCK